MKRCAICKQEFPETCDYFYFVKARNRLKCYCKKCDNNRCKVYQNENKEKIKKSRREYYLKNIESFKETSRKQRFINREENIIFQKEYRKNRVTDILNRYLFPHIGQTSDDSEEKIKYIGKTVLKLIKFSLGLIPEDDIDHYANKRVKLSGNLLEDLFRSIMLGRWGLIRRVSYTYQKLIKRKKKVALNSIIESALVTSQFIKGMSSAYWIGGITGVGQKLERLNSIKTLSHLRNVSSPLNPTQDHFEARQLHPTTFGRLCMSETPEGPTMGLVKSLALMSSITKPLKDSKKNEMIELIKKVNK